MSFQFRFVDLTFKVYFRDVNSRFLPNLLWQNDQMFYQDLPLMAEICLDTLTTSKSVAIAHLAVIYGLE